MQISRCHLRLSGRQLQVALSAVCVGVLWCLGQGCSSEHEWRDDCTRGVPALQFLGGGRTPFSLVDAAGRQIDDEGEFSLQVFYLGAPDFKMANLRLIFRDKETRYDIVMNIVPAEQFLRSKLGDRFTVATHGKTELRAVPKVDADAPKPYCEATPELSLVAEVVASQGVIDFDAHTVDADFSRELAIDLDARDLSCNLGPLRERLTATISTRDLGFGCNQMFRFASATTADASSARQSSRSSL